MSLAFDRTGSGPPLVLLHPLGADRRVWRPVVERLAEHRDVVTIDLPGFGASPALDAESPDPAALAQAVARLLEGLGLADGAAHVAGNSLGGWVALELAAAGHAASVTAIAPAGLWAGPLVSKPELARSLARSMRPVLTGALRAGRARGVLALAGSVAHPSRVPGPDAAALVDAYVRAPGFTAANRAMRSATPFAALGRISCPVTLVWCRHDRLVARAAHVPAHVREVVLADAGHIPMWDDTDGVVRVLLDGSAWAPDRVAA